MKLWITEETQANVADDIQVVRMRVESIINPVIDKQNHDDIAVDSWDVIVILRDDAVFGERFRLSKARRSMDFRMQLDYKAFVSATNAGRERLLFGLLIRSLDMLANKAPAGVVQLREDVVAIGSKHGWT